MILLVDAFPDRKRVPYTRKRAALLREALGGKFVHAVLAPELRPEDRKGVEELLWSTSAVVREMKGMGRGDAVILCGGGMARLLYEEGADTPKCLRVAYAHDDPSYKSVSDNSYMVEHFRPDILFPRQRSLLNFYHKKVPHVEWGCYGVDTDVFYPQREAPTLYHAAIGSGTAKIYKHRFKWMAELGGELSTRAVSGLSYAEYARLLASAELAVDIPNTRQLGHKIEWRLSVNYRSFEGMAMGKPVLVPDLPGYRHLFARDGLTLFYRPDYESFKQAVHAALARSDLQEYAERGLGAVRSRFSLEATTRREAEVIRGGLWGRRKEH